MSNAIIDEATLSNLGDVTRTLLSDDKTRTPDEMVADLSGIQAYDTCEFNGFVRRDTGTLDFGDVACVNLHDVAMYATSLKVGSSGANNISAVTFPDGTLRNLSTAYQMFYGCDSLVSVSLPEGSMQKVTRMDYMLYGCKSLVSVSLPEGFGRDTYTMMRAFAQCPCLTELTLPDSLSSDGISSITYMLYQDKSLTTLNLPSQFGRGVANVQ